MDRFKGKIVLVSGAGKGIGKEIVSAFAHEGAKVAFFDKNEKYVKDTENELRQLGGDYFTRTLDATDAPSVQKFLNDIANNFGKIDILINNVGIGLVKKFEQTTEEDFNTVFSVNLKSGFFVTQTAIKDMKPGSSVIFISSIHAKHPSLDPTYDASKAAINNLVLNLALTYGPKRVRVNAVSPGHIDTETSGLPRVQADVPLGKKAGMPKDVAKACLFLADNEMAGYITGANLPVTGGLHIPIAKDIEI